RREQRGNPRGRPRGDRPRRTAAGPGPQRRPRRMTYPIISADSHVTEPPNAYLDNIDPKFRDRAPHSQHIEGMGDIFVIEGMKTPIPLGIVAAAGKPAEEIRLMGTRFED